MRQALLEWTEESELDLYYTCVCSDTTVAKKDDDILKYDLSDLSFPVATDTDNLIKRLNSIKKYINKQDRQQDKQDVKLNVVFSTYQSLDVIERMQAKDNDFIFDLVICDEAHRTTGIENDSISNFNKIHDNNIIKAEKRLYMTATPKIYVASVKDENKCYSMDDEKYFGKEFYRIGFGKAVEKGLLTDYKVIVLSVNENTLSQDFIDRINNGEIIDKVKRETKNTESQLTVATKIVGCLNALMKNKLLEEDEEIIKNEDPEPMRKVVAFCNTIENSKIITNAMKKCSDYYFSGTDVDTDIENIEMNHIDGSMNVKDRDKLLDWLKNASYKDCRILSNVRCLSEGVDVPSLDAIMFLSPRQSEIDIVQSVGRVMRIAEGKKYGYIIIPVVIPFGKKPEEELDKDSFKIVWKVLRSLRSHDDNLNYEIEKINLKINKESKSSTGHIQVVDLNKITDLPQENQDTSLKEQLMFEFERNYRIEFFTRVVKKVGDRSYWSNWASDVADIVKNNIEKIKNLLVSNSTFKREFNKLLNKIHKDLNPFVSENEVIEMLAQHIVILPIFNTLFGSGKFSENNAVSKIFQKVVNILLQDQEENKKLNNYYESVKLHIIKTTTSAERQTIIKKLYENFFKVAFKSTSDKLGIVYTPIEVVDFIINSVEYILNKEFNKSFNDKNVNVLEPFSGTGSFITRLLQSGYISKNNLKYKYQKELFANEIVLLAYYTSLANIESVYEDIMGEYFPFKHLSLTDTFQLYEDSVEIKELELDDNTESIQELKNTSIDVIISNPPYSTGQKSANDDNQNLHYKNLEEKIRNTYVKDSKAQKSSMYDSYIKAFRWCSDKVKDEGVISFVVNSGWLRSNSADGFRYWLEKDFSSIYIVDLRGNIRKFNKKEGGNIFDVMVGICIVVLVKKRNKDKCNIFYHNIGDYFKKDNKLEKLKTNESIKNLDFEVITPDKNNDWLEKRVEGFENFIPLACEKKYDIRSESFFVNYSMGVQSKRDVWVYNFSKQKLIENVNTTINYYNEQRNKVISGEEDKVIKDSTKCNWSRDWDKFLSKNENIVFNESDIYISVYKPFIKEYLYFNEYLNEERFQIPKIFPNKDSQNLCICVGDFENTNESFSLVTSYNSDIHLLYSETQCFPLYYYSKDLLGNEERHYAISNYIFNKCKEKYGENITREDIFYYVYGVLNAKSYKEKFANNLKKELPRIPLLENFIEISKKGRALANLHLNYEEIDFNKDVLIQGTEMGNFKVNKMKIKGNTLFYNENIIIKNIPDEAFKYVVNGKSPIEWVVDRYKYDVDTKSQLINDANDWGDDRYIFELVLRAIEVGKRSYELIESYDVEL